MASSNWFSTIHQIESFFAVIPMATQSSDAAAFASLITLMIEMKLHVTEIIFQIKSDRVCILHYHEPRESDYGFFILQQIGLRRTRRRKLHGRAMITKIDVQVQLIKADICRDIPFCQARYRYGFEKFIYSRYDAIDYVFSCSPGSPLLFHKCKDGICGIHTGLQY